MDNNFDTKTAYTFEQYMSGEEDVDREELNEELEILSVEAAQALIEKKIKCKSQSKKRDYQIGLRQRSVKKCNFKKKGEEELEHTKLNNENMKKILELAGRGLEDITLAVTAKWSM